TTTPSAVTWGPNIPNGSGWRAPTIAATSSSLVCHDAAMRSATHRDGDVPDVVAIFADRTVRREPADIGGIEDAGPPPGVLVMPQRGDPALGGGIAVEVGADHEIVVVRDVLHQLAIAVGLVGREHAGAHGIQNTLKVRRVLDIVLRVDSFPSPRFHLVGRQAEDENI